MLIKNCFHLVNNWMLTIRNWLDQFEHCWGKLMLDEPNFLNSLLLLWLENVEIIFLNDWSWSWREFFRLHRRKWISDVTGTNTVFDVEAGNRKLGLFFVGDIGVSCPLKKELCAWPLRTMWSKEIFFWLGKISNGWLKSWWSFIWYPLSIAESSCRKEIFLIAELRKLFYQVSTSIAESPIQNDIFIIAEWRQFFQVFYRGIAMPRT